MDLTLTLVIASGLLEVGDVVGDDRTAVPLRSREDLIVGNPSIAAGLRQFGDCDNIEVALAQLERNRRRPHLVQQQPHAAD